MGRSLLLQPIDEHWTNLCPAKNSVPVGHIELADGDRYDLVAMMSVLISVLAAPRGLIWSRAALHLEVLALRHQLQVLRRSQPRRPRLTSADRWLWAWLSLAWSDWRTAVVIVKPETVIAWHRQGFRLFWTWKSRRLHGRPPVAPDARALIRTMSEQNPLWAAPRIHGELVKLGIDVSQATVAKHMARRRRPPSQTWRTFLTNHAHQIVAADFFVVPTATCRLLFVLVILAHDRRRVMHTAVTAHPTAAWTAQQFREAFPWDQAPGYLIHDRDRAFQIELVGCPFCGLESEVVRPSPPAPGRVPQRQERSGARLWCAAAGDLIPRLRRASSQRVAFRPPRV